MAIKNFKTRNGIDVDTYTLPNTVIQATVKTNSITTIDTIPMDSFISAEYLITITQGSKIRTSKVIMHDDGTSVDMTEYGITETGGTISGVVISATTASTNAVLQATITDAATTIARIKMSRNLNVIFTPVAPDAPTIGTATAGDAQASITFTAPYDNGGASISSYRATSTPGSITGTGSSSPITVTGLTNATSYTFTVAAINSAGVSAASSASNSVTPSEPRFVIGGLSGRTSSPWIAAYAWDDTTGYGAAYTSVSSLTKAVTGTRMNPSKNVVLTTSNVGGATDTVTAFPWSGASGFGTKYSAFSLTAQAFDAQFNPDNASIVVAIGSNPSILAWAWTNASGFGTQYTSWTSGPINGSGGGAIFSPDGTVVLAAQSGTNNLMHATRWSSSTGFGTNYSTVDTDAATGYQPKFTPQGTSIIYGTSSTTKSAKIIAKPWSNSTGAGTSFTEPVGYGSVGVAQTISVNSLGTVVFFGAENNINFGNAMHAYAFSNSTGWGTKYSGTAAGGTRGCQVNSTDLAVIGVGESNTAYPTPTAWSNSTGWGTVYSAPAGNPWTSSTRAFKPVFN